ncbi:hypothetical protein D3C72_1515800 [compost metagenome]
MVTFIAVERSKERTEIHGGAVFAHLPRQLLDGEDLVVEWTAPVGHQMELRAPRINLHSVRAHRKEVDHGRAEERELPGIHLASQRAWRLREQHDQLHFPVIHLGESWRESVEAKEIEPLWARKVLVYQVVAVELVPGQRQCALVRRQADIADRIAGDGVRTLAHRARFADQNGAAGTVQQLEQVRSDLVIAAQVDRQGIEAGQPGEGDVAGEP